MPAPEEKLEGPVERVVFFNEDTGYAVLRVDAKRSREPVTVVGTAPCVNPGEYLHATGTWHANPEYGRQFRASEMRCSAPSSPEGIERYLGSGLIDGIGPTYARRLVKRFGNEIFDIIDAHSARLEEVEGIGKKRRLRIKAAWAEQKVVREIMVFLHTYGVGGARAHRIYKTYGEESIERIRENPYRLARDIRGIGFKSADQIAGRLGLAGDAPSRLQAGLQHVLFEASERGHCALPREELLARAAETLAVDSDKLPPALETLAAQREIVEESISGTPLVFPRHLHESEKCIAERLRRLADARQTIPGIDADKALAWVMEKIGAPLSDGQSRAIRLAISSRVAVITGGPGVGKTTVLRALLEILSAKGVDCVLCAPTGRAAKRLSESTGRPASTIHRKLEFQAGSGRFAFHAGRRLSGDLFVVDEVSMVDAPLMRHFLLALPDAAHLVLVGDADQLPSVGPGAVLDSILRSDVVPVARLTEIFRQAAASRIITAAHAIREGRIPDLPDGKAQDCDCFFLPETDNDRVLAIVRELVRERIPRRFGLRAGQDIQVLTPMNRLTLGALNLNRELQTALNPPQQMKPEVTRFGSIFREGDRVLQTVNNYDKETFNGDLGTIASIEADPAVVRVEFDDGRRAGYTPAELDELQHAFAITIHKSQGSEFPAVVIPLSMQHYVLLQRNLVYTALTRARQLAVLVGDPKALALAVRDTNARPRFTGLAERLRDGS